MNRISRPAGRNLGVRPNLEVLGSRDVPVVFTVDTAADGFFFTQTSLRQAITLAETAPGPDVIQFAASAFDANGNCVIQLDSALLKITQPLQVVGAVPNMNRPRIRPAAGAFGFRIFDVDIPAAQKGAPVLFSSLEIEGGQTPNVADGNGGGIKSVNAALEVQDCRVLSNHAFGDGGGIWATGDQCMLWVHGTTASVSGNLADGYGGGIAVRNIYTLIQDGVRVGENKAMVSGGGIAALADNFVPRGGAAGNKILFLDGAVSPVTVTANTAQDGDGGGVFVKYTVGPVPVVEFDTALINQNKAFGTPPPGGGWTSGRGGGVAVFGAATVNANAATVVSDNGQSAPVVAPAVLGVYLDVGVAGTFATTATIQDNYLLGGGGLP